MKFQILIEPSVDGGVTAAVKSLPGCVSHGRDRDEALRKIQDSIELYLELVDEGSSFAGRAELVEISV